MISSGSNYDISGQIIRLDIRTPCFFNSVLRSDNSSFFLSNPPPALGQVNTTVGRVLSSIKHLLSILICLTGEQQIRLCKLPVVNGSSIRYCIWLTKLSSGFRQLLGFFLERGSANIAPPVRSQPGLYQNQSTSYLEQRSPISTLFYGLQ